jgi:hypothetical protein
MSCLKHFVGVLLGVGGGSSPVPVFFFSQMSISVSFLLWVGLL